METIKQFIDIQQILIDIHILYLTNTLKLAKYYNAINKLFLRYNQVESTIKYNKIYKDISTDTGHMIYNFSFTINMDYNKRMINNLYTSCYELYNKMFREI